MRSPFFTKQYRVPKRDLDPFREEQQALDLARRRASLPSRPGRTDYEFSVSDSGDAYVVTVEGSRPGGGRPSVAEPGEASGGAGNGGGGGPGEPRLAATAAGGGARLAATSARAARSEPEPERGGGRGGEAPGRTGASAGAGFSAGVEGELSFGGGPGEGIDVPGRLAAAYGTQELRNMARGLGVSTPQTADPGRIARLIAERRPGAARRRLGL
jgi:hypothetical protein